MNDVVAMLPGGVIGAGTISVTGLLLLAAHWQKIMNVFRSDKQDARAFQRMGELWDKYKEMEKDNEELRLDFMDSINLLNGISIWLALEKREMPPPLKEYFDVLMARVEERRRKHEASKGTK